MAQTSEKSNILTLQIDKTELKAEHIRNIKALLNLIKSVLTTKNESEFFEQSAESMRVCAALIKQASFIKNFQEFDQVDYDSQVLEYSIDLLQEQLDNSSVVSYDN